ncbi:hypothetical protein ABIC37_005317 [Priestia megaterium]|jgi:hypothetical protein
MKSTGIVRKIDELGRVVILKELRKLVILICLSDRSNTIVLIITYIH